MQKLATLLILLLLLIPAAASAQSTTFVVNEVDYDQPGNDNADFIEILNVGTTALDLGDFTLELVDGTGGSSSDPDGGASIYRTVTFPAGTTVPAGGYFVVCDQPDNVALCDLDVDPTGDVGGAQGFVQNGNRDGIGLRENATSLIVDALTYEAAPDNPIPAYTEGQSVSPGEPGMVTDRSLSRIPDGRDSNNNDSDFNLGNSTPNASNEFVPVEFAGFSAQTDGADVVLRWTTASEQNNAGFQVQRRTQGGQFEDVAGAFVTTKAPNGTTLEVTDYGYRLEGLDAGAYAFRLKQVDYDGAYDYSSIVEADVAARLRVSDVYPNPFRSEARFELSVPTAQNVRVEVYNVLGQRVALLHDGAVSSGQTLRPTLRAGGLSSGLYLVRVQGETFSEVRRVTLVK